MDLVVHQKYFYFTTVAISQQTLSFREKGWAFKGTLLLPGGNRMHLSKSTIISATDSVNEEFIETKDFNGIGMIQEYG